MRIIYQVAFVGLLFQGCGSVDTKLNVLDEQLERSEQVNTAYKNDSIRDNVLTSAQEQQILSNLKSLKAKTAALEKYTEELRNDFVASCGGWEPNRPTVPVNKKSTKATNNYFIGDNNDGKAYELKERLDDFIDYCNEISNNYGYDSIPYLAHDGPEHPYFKDDPELSNKDFAHLNFEDSPVVAALATLSQFELEVAKVWNKLVKLIAAEVDKMDHNN